MSKDDIDDLQKLLATVLAGAYMYRQRENFRIGKWHGVNNLTETALADARDIVQLIWEDTREYCDDCGEELSRDILKGNGVHECPEELPDYGYYGCN